MTYRAVANYYRQEAFEFFRQYRNPFYSLNFRLQFSRLKEYLDERGYRSYLNLCYFVTRAMQPIEAFRYRLLDGEMVLYDTLHPAITVPAQDGAFSFVDCRYDADVERFNRKTVLPDPEAPPRLAPHSRHTNYAYFTAIPGVPFTSFTHPTNDREDGAPRVAISKPFEEAGELWVRLSLQVNHVFVDGRPLGELYERCVAEFANPG